MYFFFIKKKNITFIFERKRFNNMKKKRVFSMKFVLKNTVAALSGINSLYKISFLKKNKIKTSIYNNMQTYLIYEKPASLCLSWKKYKLGKSATYYSSYFFFFNIRYLQLIDKLHKQNYKISENFLNPTKNFSIKSNLEHKHISKGYDKNHIEFKLNVFILKLFSKIPKMI
nr:hypothetical protein Cry52Nrm3_p127 [Cryptomonas curvata]